MSEGSLKPRLRSDMKSSMKSGEKARLLVIRLMLAAIYQIEIDERIELDDARVISVLDKMTKQRRESIEHFSSAGRDDLVAIEVAELEIIKEYLPEALSDTEIAKIMDQAIDSTGAESIKDMGRVMAFLKPRLQGRADMSEVSQHVKSKLS